MKTKLPLILVLLTAAPAFLWSRCPDDFIIRKITSRADSLEYVNLAVLLEECGEMQDSLALIYSNIGVWSFKNSNYLSAISFAQNALKIRKRILSPDDVILGKSYYYLGTFLRHNEDYKKAIPNLKTGAEIYALNGHSREISSLIELGIAYNELGDYDESLLYYDMAYNKAVVFKDTVRLNRCLIQFGLIYHNKEFYQKAVEYLKRCMVYYAEQKDSRNIATCYINLADSYYKLKNYKESIFYGQLAVKEPSVFDDPARQGIALNNLGLAYLRSGAVKKAKTSFLKAEKLGIRHQLTSLIAQSFDNLGEVFWELDNDEKALQYFHDAVKEAVPGFVEKQYWRNPSKTEIEQVPSKVSLLVYLGDKARGLLVMYENSKDIRYLTKCLETYQLCDNTIDFIRREHTGQGSKLFWREKVIPIYERAIDASYLAKDFDLGFFFFEKSKAILLLDAMADAEALSSIKNDSLINRGNELNKSLLRIREKLAYLSGTEKSAAQQELVQINDSFDIFTALMSENYPNYYKLVFETAVTNPEDFSQEQLQDGKTAFLHYFSGKKNSWLYVLTQTKRSLIPLGPSGKTDSLVVQFLSFFQNAYAIANDPEGYEKAAWELYEYIMAPASLSGIEHLIIVPDGILGFLPFGALITQQEKQNDLSGQAYLIRKYDIRLSFSATILDKQNRHLNANKRLLAFAPFSANGSGGKFPILPYSDDELSSIEWMVAGNYFKDKSASKMEFLNNVVGFSVAHISTHASANETLGQPFIVFADTILNLRELYGLNLPVELIVLSGCETNIGEVKSGEGIFSLSRGFTYAGAKSIISSLWNVNASSTGKIFPEFYDYLQKGNSKSIALRDAKLKYINEPNGNGHIKTPYDWAGFVLIGNNDNIELESPLNKWWYLILLPGIGLLVWWLKKNSLPTMQNEKTNPRQRT